MLEKVGYDMDEEMNTPPARRSSARAKKIGAKVGVVLADPNVRAQAARDRLAALENDIVVQEPIDLDDDEDASLDDDDGGFSQKVRAPKSTRRKTRRAKAMEKSESTKKIPRVFFDILKEANLEELPANVPTYVKAAVGQPRSAARRHFCSVCGYLAPYTCTRCGIRFCSWRCKVVHNDTRCQKFIM